MKALLRADWLRFRRRKDFWIIAIAVLVVGGVGFVSAYHTDSTDPTWLDQTPAQIREQYLGYGGVVGVNQAGIDGQADPLVAPPAAQQAPEGAGREARQAGGHPTAGHDPSPLPHPRPRALAAMVVISLGLALTVLLRSGAMPLLLIILAGLVELFVGLLPIFAATECPFAGPTSDPSSGAVCWSALAGVPQVFLARSIRTILAQLGSETHALVFAGDPVPTGPIGLPVLAIAGIIAAWGVLFLIVADRRFRTMDVVEWAPIAIQG